MSSCFNPLVHIVSRLFTHDGTCSWHMHMVLPYTYVQLTTTGSLQVSSSNKIIVYHHHDHLITVSSLSCNYAICCHVHNIHGASVHVIYATKCMSYCYIIYVHDINFLSLVYLEHILQSPCCKLNMLNGRWSCYRIYVHNMHNITRKSTASVVFVPGVNTFL